MDTFLSQSDAVIVDIKDRLQRESGGPLYIQIAELIADLIASDRLEPGTHLPAQRDLCVAWGVGQGTVRRALQRLASRGLLRATPGSGTVVVRPEPHHTPAAQPENPPAPTHSSAPPSPGRKPQTGVVRIGVAFADLADGYPFFAPILDGLRDDPEPIAVQLFDMPHAGQQARRHGSPHRPAYVPPTDLVLDALVMMSPINPGLLAWSHQQGLPTVLLFNDLADGVSHCLMPNYASGLTEAVEHLVQSGRRRIAIVTASPQRFSTGRWLTAYRAVLRAFALPARPEWEIAASYTEEHGAQATRQLLNLREPPDAIVYASDTMARGGFAATQQLGRSGSDGLVLIGAGRGEPGSSAAPGIGSIDLALPEMGRLARRMIKTALAQPDTPASRYAIDTRFTPAQPIVM